MTEQLHDDLMVYIATERAAAERALNRLIHPDDRRAAREHIELAEYAEHQVRRIAELQGERR